MTSRPSERTWSEWAEGSRIHLPPVVRYHRLILHGREWGLCQGALLPFLVGD
jgi:hypothetical protein